MSEPTDAHYWMPCMDQPYDKAESEISIIVPNGIETGSNGTLLSKVAYTPASTIWNWKSDEPIATYLMVADASTFIHWSETHERSTAPGDTVHLDFYAWPSDYYQDSITDGSVYNAQYFLSRTSQIMSWLEAKYGGFPFVKYGQVPVQPFTYGGMEHQSITSIHRRWLRGNDQGIAHEMAHQWFGDKTTCETFKDIWLNEGFATYSEAVWGEAWGGNNQYMNMLYGNAGWYLYDTASSKYAIYDPPEDDLFNFARTYCKGACILHMLRRMVGNDTMFFGAMHDYSNAFAFSTINTAQFRDYMGPRLGIDLNEYIDQWVFGALYPEYDIKWAQNGNNLFFLRINQDQTVRDHFTMPVKLFAYHNEAIDTLIFYNDSRSQGFQKSVSYQIDSLKFDRDALLLSTYLTASGDTVGISQKVRSTLLQNSPDLAVRSTAELGSLFSVYPEYGELLCKFTVPTSAGILELYNSVGMTISVTSVASGENQKALDIRNLSSGIYLVRYTNETTSEVHSVNIVR
jgi:aminopeptidase N